MVDLRGIEPRSARCKRAILPLNERPMVAAPGVEPGYALPYEGRLLPNSPQRRNLVAAPGIEPGDSTLSGSRPTGEHGGRGAPCQIRTDFSGLQVRRIAIYAYRAHNLGANGANRTLIGCLPCNCSPIELHRHGAGRGIRNPGLRVTNAVLLHLSYSGMERVRRIELR